MRDSLFMKTSLILAIFLSLSLSACVTTRAQLHQDTTPATEENESSVTSETVEPVRKQTRSNSSAAASQNQSGGYALEETRAMLASLSGRVDELEQKLSKSGENSEEFKKLQAKVEELEKKLAAPVVVASPASESRDHFASGKEAYSAGRLEDAIQHFEEYLKNPSSDHQEEAIFLKGEAHFRQKNYKKAIVEFSKFPEKFPKSNYGARALMKIAESFEGLGMKEDAKAFYTDLIEKYPRSPEGKAAKKRISGKKK